MISWLSFVAVVLTLSTLLLNFGFAFLLRLSAKSTFIEKNYAYQPKVSILMPCFNEGQRILETIQSIVMSNYPPEKIEIIAIDDCSKDDTYQWLEKAAEKWSNLIVFRNSVNSGKHHSLSSALLHSTGEILICIDSDTIFDANAIRELTACFVDDTIGGVGGRVGVSNPRENFLTQGQTFVYYYTYHIMKMMENWARNVTCVSGCLFALRRQYFEVIKEQVAERNWLGIGVRDGEDRYMSHLLLLNGWKTYINIDAQCWTEVPSNFKQLFMQQLRWRRGSLRSFFWTLRTFNLHLKKLHPLVILSIVIPEIFVILQPAAYLLALLVPGWVAEKPFIVLSGFSMYVALAALVNIYIKKYNPEQQINPLIAAFVFVWFDTSVLITICALATFDVGEWGTRDEVSKNTSSTSPPQL